MKLGTYKVDAPHEKITNSLNKLDSVCRNAAVGNGGEKLGGNVRNGEHSTTDRERHLPRRIGRGTKYIQRESSGTSARTMGSIAASKRRA